MADKKATREALGDELTALGAVREDLVVLTADLADATRVEYFRHKYPERFIECGIAEANMMGVAAGLAATGKVAVALLCLPQAERSSRSVTASATPSST